MWRTLHRWIAIVAALFLAYVAVTGMLLAMDDIALRLSGLLPVANGGEVPNQPQALTTLQPQDLARWLGNVERGARRIAPEARFNSVWVRVRGNRIQGIVTTGAPDPRQLTFDAVSGERLLPDSPSLRPTGYVLRWDIHQIVKRLHRGDFFGLTGRWMSVACGLSLLFLVCSALVMYGQLLLARRRLGRNALFWK